MKQLRYILPVVGGLLTCLSLKAGVTGEVLWWMVDDDSDPPPVVDWYGTPSTIADTGANSARLRVEDAGGTVTYLDFYMLDPETEEFERWPGVEGAGIPMWAFTDVSQYSSSEYSFAVELGNWEAGEWVTTLASTELVPYDSIASHIAEWQGIEAIPTLAWSPTTYSVPEPSSGLLMLLGGALLALRRRKGR